MVRQLFRAHRTGASPECPIRATAFALNAGAVVDATSLLHVDTMPSQGRRLLLSVEPLEPSVRGVELAALALTTLRQTFANATGLPPAAALMKAFTAANAVLINENRPLAGCRWERRVYVGATGIVISGREMLIAQIPPTATMIVQDHHLYAFPELASWRHDYMPPSNDPEPEPLGCREGTRPYLFRTVAAAGDVITFCSTAIARHLGREEATSLEPLLAGDPETALDYLGDIAIQQELDDAHAAVVHLRRLTPDHGFPRISFPGSRQASKTWPIVVPQVARAHASTQTPARASGLPVGSSPVYAVRTDWGAVGIPLDQPLPADFGESHEATGTINARRPRRLSLPFGHVRHRLANLVDRVPVRAGPSRPAVDPLFRARHGALAAPGAGSIRRYREQATFPAEWRSNLPRGLDVHVPSRLLTVGLVLFLAFGGSGALLDRYRHQIARADAALATVDGSLQAISADPTSAASALAAAEAALAEARSAGADTATVHQQALAVDAARDVAWSNLRLHGMTRLGALPPALTQHPVQLARTGRDIWLIGGSLFGLDQANQRLVQVLAPGAAVQGGIVQSLRSGVADGGRLLVLDDAALYARDDTGRWQRHYMTADTSELRRTNTALATYQGSLYALDTGGQLLKFAADRLTETPELRVSAANYPDLAAARDVVVDGRIHMLLGDGRILTFYQGTLEAVLVPDVTPALVNPSHLVGGPDTNFLYLVDTDAEIGLTAGRIIRLDGAGNARQILPPLPIAADAATAHILREVRDLVVDEEAGLIFFITDTDLWQATLPQ